MSRIKVVKDNLSNVEMAKAMLPAIYAPRMAAGQVGQNQLAGAHWAVAAEEYLEEVVAILAPINTFSTDFSNQCFAKDANVVPAINVEIIKSIGSTTENTDDWENSKIENEFKTVTLKRYNTPFGISLNDIQDGAKMGKYLGTAIKEQATFIMNKLFAKIAAENIETVTVPDVDNFGPQYFTSKLSRSIKPRVVTALLDTLYYAALLPWDKLGIGISNLGADNVHESQDVENLLAGKDAVGLLAHPAGIAVAARLPQINEIPGISVIPLGTYAGIPFVLKQWAQPRKEQIWHSVESQIGFEVALPKFLRVLRKAAPAEKSATK